MDFRGDCGLPGSRVVLSNSRRGYRLTPTCEPHRLALLLRGFAVHLPYLRDGLRRLLTTRTSRPAPRHAIDGYRIGQERVRIAWSLSGLRIVAVSVPRWPPAIA